MYVSSGGNDQRNEDSWYPTKKELSLNFLIHQKNEEIEKLKKKIASQAGDIDSLKKRIAELEEEVRQLKEELTETRKTLTSLQGNHNILLIGEMCRKFQANVYQSVFPGMRISPYYSYKMADLEQDIDNIKSEREKAKARKLWEQLKLREDPEKFQNLVEELQKLRNTTAHPEITHLDVKDVLRAAEEVNKQGDFEFLRLKGGFNFEDVKELIKMCGRIERDVKDSKK